MQLDILCVLSSYNRPTMIIDAVKSVFKQTYKKWHLLIADDGSDYDVESTISSIDGYDPTKVTLFRSDYEEREYSQITSYNRLASCITKAVEKNLIYSDLMCYLCDDDWYHRSWFRRAMDVFTSDLTANVVYGKLYYIHTDESDKVTNPNDFLFKTSFVDPSNNMDHNQFMHRSKFYRPWVAYDSPPDARYLNNLWVSTDKQGWLSLPLPVAYKRCHGFNAMSRKDYTKTCE